MNLRTLTLLLAGLLSATALSAHAVPEGRVARQHHRIVQGVAQGQLTRAEARRLGREQAHIRHDLVRARADGHVTPVERAHLRAEQDRASAHIARARHNARTR